MADTPMEPARLAACVERSVAGQGDAAAPPSPIKAWVPLAERFPWWNGIYTVWRPGTAPRKADWSNKGWRDVATDEGLGLFTHWMPMPERAVGVVALTRAAERAESAPWLACDAGESTRRGQFELRVFGAGDCWCWRVSCRNPRPTPQNAMSILTVAMGDDAPSLAAAKAAALKVGGWAR